MDFVGTIFRAFLKAYECCPHNRIIAKFKDCSISKEGLKILLDFVCSTNNAFKLDHLTVCYVAWHKKKGVQQGKFLWPLLFNVLLKIPSMFSEKSEIFNFADGNTRYGRGK